MLVAKIYVNHRQIDEIHIQNTGEKDNFGFTKYMIRKPDLGLKPADLWHIREKGYNKLLTMALERIELCTEEENGQL